jgi:hypothetical protein
MEIFDVPAGESETSTITKSGSERKSCRNKNNRHLFTTFGGGMNII